METTAGFQIINSCMIGYGLKTKIFYGPPAAVVFDSLAAAGVYDDFQTHLSREGHIYKTLRVEEIAVANDTEF